MKLLLIAICIIGAMADTEGSGSFVGLRDGMIGVAHVKPLTTGFNQPIMEHEAIHSADGGLYTLDVGEFNLNPVESHQLESPHLAFTQAIYGEAKPIPNSFVAPMMERATKSQNAPVMAPHADAFPKPKGVQAIREFRFVNAPVMNSFQTLPVLELPNIIQRYAVPQTFTTQENIKQPITQPIWQPYLQRYEQQPVPVVQPIVNRVVQPVLHRQLHPYLSSEVVTGPQQQPIVNAPQILQFKNDAIVGSDLSPLPLDDRSVKPDLPIVAPLADLSKRQVKPIVSTKSSAATTAAPAS